MVSAVEARIRLHSHSVASGDIHPPQGPCPRCHQAPGWFRVHERRGRFFRFVVESVVHTIASVLLRWKCPVCGKTFTDYPDFAWPYKRYVVEDIERLSSAYLESERRSYRQTVLHDNLPIGYQDKPDGIDERMLAHSTPWRWISLLGAMKKTLSQTLHLIEQKAPESTIIRRMLPVHPSKYRSERRKSILTTAKWLLDAGRRFHDLFNSKVVPRLATACGWA